MPNCPEYLLVLYATWMLGGVAVPINYRFRPEELTFVISDAELTWLVLSEEDAQRLHDILRSHPEIRLLLKGEGQTSTTHTWLSDIYQAKEKGSPTPSAFCDFFEAAIGVSLFEIYGQTELSGLLVTYRLGEQRIPGSMGKPMAQVVETRIVSADGQRLIAPGEDEAGVLYFKGDVVTPGYWKRDELNEERFADGWLKTGDIVRWDEDGYLFYTDRFDDLIVTGGENVYPKEVENILAEHPAVAEVAVIGTPHPRWIEQVTAIVVTRDATVTVRDIDTFCMEHRGLAGYKRPRRIEIVQELPKTGSGKINKSFLKEQYREEQTSAEDVS